MNSIVEKYLHSVTCEQVTAICQGNKDELDMGLFVLFSFVIMFYFEIN
jgi:hypothetical protein